MQKILREQDGPSKENLQREFNQLKDDLGNLYEENEVLSVAIVLIQTETESRNQKINRNYQKARRRKRRNHKTEGKSPR